MQNIVTVVIVIIAITASLMMWNKAREANHKSEELLQEFKDIDNSLKKPVNDNTRPGVGAISKDSILSTAPASFTK